MKNNRLIEVKLPKATLFLTVEEFKAGLKRGKAIVRARSLSKRTERVTGNQEADK